MPFREAFLDLTQAYFVDDFGGASYDSRLWAVTVGGASSVATTSALGGQLLFTVAASGGTCLLDQGAGQNFSMAKNLKLRWRIDMGTRTNFRFEVGARTDANNELAWISDSSVSANWLCESRLSGSPTTRTTSVAVDTNWHELEIVCTSSSALFLLDGALIETITTTLPTGDLEPYAYGITSGAAARTVLLDFAEAYGDRD